MSFLQKYTGHPSGELFVDPGGNVCLAVSDIGIFYHNISMLLNIMLDDNPGRGNPPTDVPAQHLDGRKNGYQ